MRTAPVFVFALLSCLFRSGVIRADDKTDTDARRAMEMAIKELDAAYNRGDAKGVASAYTETAQLFPPNRPIASGRAGIEKFNRSMLDLGYKGMESTLTEIEVYNNVAFASGTMKLWGQDKS